MALTTTAVATAALNATVDAIEVAVYTIPTDAPEADGTLAWDSTTMVLVEIRSGDTCGIGWTYGPPACARVISDQLADVVLGGDALDVGGAFDGMVKAVRNAGRPGAVGYARPGNGLRLRREVASRYQVGATACHERNSA